MNKSLKPHLNPGEYVFVLTDNIYGINEEDILCSFKEDGKYSLILKKEFANKYLVTPIIDSDRFLCSFSHRFAGGYSAGYYSYKWAEIMSADSFGMFEENMDRQKEIGLSLIHI